MFIQFLTVQVACWWNWILWRISSAVHTVNGCRGCCLCLFAFHCFPSFSIFCHFYPGVVAFYFIAFPLAWGNQQISSAHLFFVLPAGLFVWCMVLRAGFHFAAFFAHRSSGSDAILVVKRHFSNPAWDFGCFHPFNCCGCASFHVFDPIFLFTFACVNLFIGVCHEGNVAVLVAICV